MWDDLWVNYRTSWGSWISIWITMNSLSFTEMIFLKTLQVHVEQRWQQEVEHRHSLSCSEGSSRFPLYSHCGQMWPSSVWKTCKKNKRLCDVRFRRSRDKLQQRITVSHQPAFWMRIRKTNSQESWVSLTKLLKKNKKITQIVNNLDLL